jgi:hypothetical protein
MEKADVRDSVENQRMPSSVLMRLRAQLADQLPRKRQVPRISQQHLS